MPEGEPIPESVINPSIPPNTSDPNSLNILVETQKRKEHLLNEKHQEMLRLAGQGIIENEIGRRLGFAHATIKNNFSIIFKSLGVHTQSQAVLVALDRGELKLEDMVPPGYDFTSFLNLTESQHALLKVLTNKDEHGYYPALNTDLAIRLQKRPHTIDNALNVIYTQLGIQSRPQLAVLYRAFLPKVEKLQEEAVSQKEQGSLLNKNQREMVRLLGLGLSEKEIALKLNFALSTVKNHFTDIYKALAVEGATQAVLVALDKEELRLEEMISAEYNFKLFLGLTPDQLAVLQAFTEKDQKGHYPAVNTDIVDKLQKDILTIKRINAAIYVQLGIHSRPQAAVLYRAYLPRAEKLQEEARLETAHQGLLAQRLDTQQREIVKLIGQGLPNNQIASRLGFASQTIDNKLTAIFRSLQARNRTELIVSAIERGELSASELLPENIDLQDIEDMPQILKDVLPKIVENHGGDSAKEVAGRLGVTLTTFRKRLGAIYEYLNLPKTSSETNRYVSTLVAYLASQEQKQTEEQGLQATQV